MTRSTGLPGFTSSVAPIGAALARRMSSSWPAGCPVALTDLAYLRLTYLGFDHRAHQGELVVAMVVAAQVAAAFHSLYLARFPIHRMQLVTDFGGHDDASMAADNTSGFNCRLTTAGTTWSQHSYGQAVDINPVENPYLSGDTVSPPAGEAFVDRPDRPGVVHAGDACVRAFGAIGWSWGGYWSNPRDSQHFSANGR